MASSEFREAYQQVIEFAEEKDKSYAFLKAFFQEKPEPEELIESYREFIYREINFYCYLSVSFMGHILGTAMQKKRSIYQHLTKYRLASLKRFSSMVDDFLAPVIKKMYQSKSVSKN